MSEVLPEFLFILALILANGYFAAAEMAMVTAKKARLQAMQEEGHPRAAETLAIQEKPGNFLATVQIGITLVSSLASAVGGVSASNLLVPLIAQVPVLAPYARSIALAFVVLVISYLSLVLGELVPKRLALRNPEGIAISVSGFFRVLSRIAFIPIRLLDISANFVFRVFGSARATSPSTTSEEIEIIVKQASMEGVIEEVEGELISGVFEYADMRLWDVMTPRTSIVAVEADTRPEEALKLAQQHGFSRYPVYEDDLDNIIGYLHVKDLLWAQDNFELRSLVREVIYFPGGIALPVAFTRLTRAGKHMAIVLDEYGGTDGLLTLEDLLEVIVGEIEDEHSPLAATPEMSKNGEWVFGGTTPISVVEEHLKIDFEADGTYVTLAGFILAELGNIPHVGEQVRKFGYEFTVADMDKLRVAGVHVRVLRPGD